MCILVCGGGATYGRICVAWHEPCATGQLLLLPLTHSIHRLFCNMLLLLVYFFFFFSLCIDWNRLQYAIKPIFLFWLLEEEGTTRKSCRKKHNNKEMLYCVYLNPVRQRKVIGFVSSSFLSVWKGENTFVNIRTAHTCHRQPQKS